MPNENQVHEHEAHQGTAHHGHAAEVEAVEVSIPAGKNADKVVPLLAKGDMELRDYKFSFKKVDEVDNEGKPTGVKTKRDAFSGQLPFVTMNGLISSLHDEKISQLVLETINDELIARAAKEQVSSNYAWTDLSEIDLSKLTLEYIANTPATDRRGGGIPKELWDVFTKDYVSIMPSLMPDKKIENITNACTMFTKKLTTVRTNKPILQQLQGYLGMWWDHSEQKEDLAPIFEYLMEKSEEFLKKDEKELLLAI